MQQVIQNIRSGKLTVESVPAPCVAPGQVLIANQASLISSGTEKMIMDLAKKSLLGKARQRPDHVKRVLQKIRNEGLLNTVHSVRTKLNEPMSMGYSSAGIVLACGDGVQHFKPGDRVASNGPHADVVSVPANLCAHVPESVALDHASFAVLGSIAMQGVRLSQCHLGETVLVIGLGLVGQLTVAIARAAGLKVLGTDPDASKCELATQMGATLARPNMSVDVIDEFTGGLGADAVIITASTDSNRPIELAANAVRQRGRVVLVGVVGLELDRRPFYFKEAEFVVSCSYGPGRYDPDYEQRGHDYPAAYVRWTEQRNIQSVIDLMASGQLDVRPLISHRFEIDQAPGAYQMIEQNEEPFLGVILEYPHAQSAAQQNQIRLKPTATESGKIPYAVLGTGNFARMVMLPCIQKNGGFSPVAVCSGKGVTATQTAREMGFQIAATDEGQVFSDSAITTVFSFTRHDLHAKHVIKAIKAGKNIFVEKPLCITADELLEIDQQLAATATPPLVMVGFNRRYSPAARELRTFFDQSDAPKTVSIRFNAGEIPGDHWTQHDQEGGGRIIGEACHGIDLATFLTGSIPTRVYAESVRNPTTGAISDDQCFITLRHANGSVSSIAYLSGGDKAFPKERVEVFGGGMVGLIDDFRAVVTCKNGKTTRSKSALDKGHQNEIEALRSELVGNSGRVPTWHETRAVTLASILAVRSLREGMPLAIGQTDPYSTQDRQANPEARDACVADSFRD